jgi:hypothetical protein
MPRLSGVLVKRTAKSVEHVVMGDGDIRCLNCGRAQAFPAEMSIPIFGAIGKAFEREHEKCRPSPAGAARFEFSTPEQWLASWDTGISSKSIFWVLAGRHPVGQGFLPDAPHDPEDFGRCYQLLKGIPGWRERLSEVAARYPDSPWPSLVARWGELEKFYEEELPSGRAPKLYALMQELRARTTSAETSS